MLVNRFPSRKIIVDDQKYLYFGGTSYLGLPTNKKFLKIITENLLTWGSSYGSSRNANIKLSAYSQAEIFLAEFIKSESALTISSGMLAGKIVIAVLKNQTDSFFHFPNLHDALKTENSQPILIDGKLNEKLLNDVSEKITILTDGVPSSFVKPIDFDILTQIPKNKEITLVIDESHSLGIVGENGCGIFSNINLPNIKRKIMIASLGKALGLTGGLIGGDAQFINDLRNNNSFISAAGMNPAFANSLSSAKDLIIKQHRKLKKNLHYINKNLIKSPSIDFDENYPLLYPKIKNVYQILKEQKIIITNFPYPNEAGELNRIVITANHKKKDLDKIILILNHENKKTQT